MPAPDTAHKLRSLKKSRSLALNFVGIFAAIAVIPLVVDFLPRAVEIRWVVFFFMMSFGCIFEYVMQDHSIKEFRTHPSGPVSWADLRLRFLLVTGIAGGTSWAASFILM